ncbi:hypothetical protein [Bacteroides finegoldii]|nr:hypothetical protein [Bacteroides finegoldii]EEX46697.1 hypothetical protein BACFIN_05733 [Bacteroides finegoldii DSM 17565]
MRYKGETDKKGRCCLRQVLEEDAALRRARMSVKKTAGRISPSHL